MLEPRTGRTDEKKQDFVNEVWEIISTGCNGIRRGTGQRFSVVGDNNTYPRGCGGDGNDVSFGRYGRGTCKGNLRTQWSW